MSIPVVINSTTYNLPTAGQSPNWGADLSDIILALVDVANNTSGSGDILNTTFSPLNNVTSASNVTGLAFNSSAVRSANITYSVDRSTSSNELSESGQITITFNSLGGSWELQQTSVGDAGIHFTLPNNGQFQYVTTNMSGSNYIGQMVFSAKSFLIS